MQTTPPDPRDASAATRSDDVLSVMAEALHYFGAHRPDSPRHSAWQTLDKFLEGDPVEVRPPDPLAGSQAGSNGPRRPKRNWQRSRRPSA